MARGTAAFERIINLQLQKLQPPKFQKEHARIAKQVLANGLAKRTDTPEVVRFVDGQKGAPEESVRYGGVIRYELQSLARIAQWALARARELSPVESGAYKEAWFVMAGGAVVSAEAIPNGVELVLTNDQPYHRKLEMTVNQPGGNRTSARLPPGIVERVRQELFREFGRTFVAEIKFIQLQGGYVLKGRQRLVKAKQDGRSSAFRAGRRHLAGRKDTAAGQQMTYPALILGPL
jgi:hypothetical protein